MISADLNKWDSILFFFAEWCEFCLAASYFLNGNMNLGDPFYYTDGVNSVLYTMLFVTKPTGWH